MDYLAGIDIGTTHIKAYIFDVHGNELSGVIEPTPVNSSAEGRAEYSPDVLWSTVCSAIRKALYPKNKETKNLSVNIKGIAVAGMAEAGLPVDIDGNPLYPIIAWYDKRTKEYPGFIKEHIGEDKITGITGQKIQHIFTLNKIMWLKDNEPKIHSKIKKWLGVSGFINFMLTGEYVMDYSLAVRTMMFDIRRGSWADELLTHAGIDSSVLPALVGSGQLIGSVTQAAAEKTGLNAGTPVFAGGHDHICSALAVGAVEKGVFMDSSGTAEPVLTTMHDIDELLDYGKMGFSIGHHVVKDKYYLYGSITSSGSSADWYHKRLSSEPLDESIRTAGAKSLLFLPHLYGSSSPERDPVSKGAFIGIRPHHTQTDFSQAVYEGLSFELKKIIETISKGSGIEKIISVGGGTKNNTWMQTKADVLQMPIEVPVVQEGTAMGAALLAGIGAGIYKDGKDAVEKTYHKAKVIVPRPDKAKVYNRVYEVYKKLEKTLYEVNADLEREEL